MIIEKTVNGYHAVQRSISGRVYCGYAPTRNEAILYCLELLPEIERRIEIKRQRAAIAAGRTQWAS
jgi:hypothetical protein